MFCFDKLSDLNIYLKLKFQCFLTANWKKNQNISNKTQMNLYFFFASPECTAIKAAIDISLR